MEDGSCGRMWEAGGGRSEIAGSPPSGFMLSIARRWALAKGNKAISWKRTSLSGTIIISLKVNNNDLNSLNDNCVCILRTMTRARTAECRGRGTESRDRGGGDCT